MNHDEKNTKTTQDDSNNNPKQEPTIVREEDIIKTEPIRINESFSREDRNISGKKDQPENNSSKDKE